ncbi:MAG: hypothetical protein KAI39_06255 [Desulfobulbaceae bacterium]|nr:hypothetical protein [Desulfobulbaceae bacterium]
MDKQVLAVIFSFALYVFYVLLPMIPSIIIYRIFPDTKVSATGVLANLNFKTTGAFGAYVITVVLGYFLVQNTHQLIAQICTPVWTIKTKVELLNSDGTQYANKSFLETLTVTIDPKLHTIDPDGVILRLPGNKTNWETTQLRFEIPRFGYKVMDVSEISENAEVDEYKLIVERKKPIQIKVNEQLITNYSGDSAKALTPDNSTGPKLEN